MKLGQVRKADIVIASHGHVDHIGDSYEICKRTKAKFVGNYELCVVAEEVHGLKMGSRAMAMNPGGTIGRVLVPAFVLSKLHGSADGTDAKGLCRNNRSIFPIPGRMDGVIPVSVKGVTFEDDVGHLFIADGDALGVGPLVDFGSDTQSGFRGR